MARALRRVSVALTLAALAGAPFFGLDAGRLAHYMLEVAQCLERQSGSALLAGRLGWPTPRP